MVFPRRMENKGEGSRRNVRKKHRNNGNKERRHKKRVQESMNVEKKKETERERERVVYELTPDEKARSPAKFKFL